MLLAVPDDNALHGAALLHDLGCRRHADASLDGRSKVKRRLIFKDGENVKWVEMTH